MSTAAKTPNYNLSQVVGSDIPDWITDYTSDMGKIDAALKENADDVDVVRPDEFSEESTYVAGDYCIKNNVIYKAKTAVAAGAFDVSDWEATSIFKELSALTNKTNLKYTEGTGCNVFYNNSVVFIHLNVSGITAANDEIITKIVLPDGISVKLYRPVWILANLMGSNWIPTNEAIYLSFGDTHTLKSPAFRVKSGSVSNATIAGTYVFPRDLFDIT